MNPYPQKKIITFNKHTSDFSFNVNYADLENLPAEEREYLGSPNISEYHLIGVADALKKNTGENVETKGIKKTFFFYFLIQFLSFLWLLKNYLYYLFIYFVRRTMIRFKGNFCNYYHKLAFMNIFIFNLNLNVYYKVNKKKITISFI